MKESYCGYENQLFKEEDLTGEEEEMPSFRGRARGGCVKCQHTRSLQLAVRLLYAVFAFIVIALAVLASLVFRKVDSLLDDEVIYQKKMGKLQESLEDLSAVKNCTEVYSAAQFRDEIARLKKELEDIHEKVLGQEQMMDLASQSQDTMTQSNGRMLHDVQAYGFMVRQINQSLEQYQDQVNGWQDVISETDQKMKTLVQDQYDLKGTVHHVNTTVTLTALWIQALQRKAEEEALVLQRMTTDWQNYSRTLSALKSNSSATMQTMRAIQSGISNTYQRLGLSSEMVHDLTLQVMNLQVQLDNISSFIDEHEENMHDHQYHAKYYENRTGERFVTLDTRMSSIELEIETIASSINATVSHVQSMYKYINMESSSCNSKLGRHTDDLRNMNNTALLLLDLADSLRAQYMTLSVRLDMDVRNLSMVMEEMKLLDTKHSQLIQNFTILKGAPGPPGPKGNKGDAGQTGPKGNSGVRGNRGFVGPPGPIGPKGAVGAKGDPGEPGPSGDRGHPGAKGAKGSLGQPGPRGDKGQKGDMGVSGKDGAQGRMGPAGNQGEAGVPGIRGFPGTKGKPGPAGPPGPPGPPGLPGNST